MEQNFSNDDPLLTAYALGELEGAELAAVEARLAGDPAARAAVTEIRALEMRLQTALAHEAFVEGVPATPAQKVVPRPDRYVKPVRPWGKWFEFPRLYFVATGMATACFLMMFLQPQAERRSALARARHYQEIDLTSSASEPRAPEETAAASANVIELQRFPRAKQETAANDKKARLDTDAREADAELANDRRQVAMRAAAPAPMVRDELRAKTAAPAERAKVLALADFGSTDFPRQQPQSLAAISGFLAEQKSPAAAGNFAPKSELAGAGADAALPAPAFADALKGGLPTEHRFLDPHNFPAAKISWKVSTESWTAVQAALEAGRKPVPDSVRIEELLRQFTPKADGSEMPDTFSARLEVASAPWTPSHRLARATLTSASRRPENTVAGGKAGTVARDVRLSVEFNPATVASYRLIGFENAAVEAAEVHPDLLNAVVVNPGEAVTALFEIVPAEHPSASAGHFPGTSDPLLVVKLDYRLDDGGAARVQEFSLRENETDFSHASPDFKFAAAVAGFGMILRDSPFRGTATFKDVISWAREGLGENETESRTHFIDLAKKAEEIAQ